MATKEYITLQYIYRERIMEILNNQEIPILEREFYSESGNWLQNNDFENMIDTLVWLTRTNEEKKAILNEDLDDYFNCE
tara:strand:- start:293 stop:529 length:237 start_codon:yes stop_codon:yes gene_type:complete